MRVNVIQGDRDMFRNIVYGMPNSNVMEFVNSKMNEFTNYLGNTADKFTNNIKMMYDKYASNEALNRAKMLLNLAGTSVNEESVYFVGMNSYHNVNLAMQRYIIANPTINEMYQKNMCYGFEETYHDNEVGVTGKDRNDYRSVMDGVIQYDQDGNGYVYHYSSNDEINPELSAVDKFTIIETWDELEIALLEDIDPTDPNGGEI